MDIQTFSRSQALNNIPGKKSEMYIQNVQKSNLSFQNKNIKISAVNRWIDSNIPVDYWDISMEKDFSGSKDLLNNYNEYIKDLNSSYINGNSILFAGNHGLGKTFTSCSILKVASLKSYKCLYTTLTDSINVLLNGSNEDKYLSRRELIMVDFLVMDEVDPRFIGSEQASDLYARTLESIFRTRSQNKLPTLMCSNSPNIEESFRGSLKASIDSLMKGYLKIIPIIGQDFRKKQDVRP